MLSGGYDVKVMRDSMTAKGEFLWLAADYPVGVD
jgi:hypothetical protein